MLKKSLLISFIIIVLFSMIINPKIFFEAALNGLKIWVLILVPALLPFFIIANLLMGLGVTNFLGILLDPVMRPLFNVSGAGGFILAIGFTSGFPISSLLTADLRLQNKLTREEAERLMSFTNNASPLFMFSAISVGMFNTPELGYILAAGHYISNIILGIILGLLSRKKKLFAKQEGLILKKAVYDLYRTPNVPVGQILGDSINKAIKNIITIGGFVIFFAITITTFKERGIFLLLNYVFQIPLNLIGFDPSLATALSTGFFEVTLGIKQASETNVVFYQQVAIAAFILAWSGLSIHAQVANFISKTDLRFKTFFKTRIAHCILAPVITLFLLPIHETALSYAKHETANYFQLLINLSESWVVFSGMLFLIIIGSLLILSIFFSTIKKLLKKYNF